MTYYVQWINGATDGTWRDAEVVDIQSLKNLVSTIVSGKDQCTTIEIRDEESVGE